VGFHHVALATRDLEATHAFYTEAMGFELVKVVVAPTESGQGWAKHVFYETPGDGMIAFWDLHDDTLPEFDGAMSTGIGLPAWVNHLAFHAEVDELEGRIERWTAHGLDVLEVDHGFCRSIYTLDPNGTMVEWCADTRVLDEEDRKAALAVLFDPNPELEDPPVPVFHKKQKKVAAAAGAPTA